MPNTATKPSSTSSRPNIPRGMPCTGRIVTLVIGHCHGFIRLPNARDVYFHRADLQAGTAFNDMRVGDVVGFELLEDPVSGARALRIERQKSTR
jgi:hypothetical protein